jgi:ribose transport system ATP-binding protein
MAEDDHVLLTVERLTKRFTGTLALDSVDFDVRAGEVHALLGENGAGKSTLIKILAGVHAADAGEIYWRGAIVDPAAKALPIAFIHQDLGLVDAMTVAENMAIITGYPRRPGGLISWPRARAAALAALERMGGGIDPDSRVGDLPAAAKSIVAIARAMALKSDVLVLDEPTAALPETDVAVLLDALRRLRAGGTGIVYVTHRLDEVFRCADCVTVLRDGRRVVTERVAETDPARLVHNIVGRPLSELFVRPSAKIGDPLLTVEDLTATGVGPVSFEIARGQVVGLVGLRGAGHDTTGRVIFGDRPIAGGRITFDGEAIAAATPAAMVGRRVGFVSSKRGEESLAPNLTVRENLYINPPVNGVPVLRAIGLGAERQRCLQALRHFSVRPPDTERLIATLSGGNQQKVVLARWLEAKSRLLILEEPTFGVDVGSKAEIYQLLQAALDERSSVLLISSDFEEVTGVCHRALVFDHGRIIGELTRSELSVQRLTALASGSARVEQENSA